MNLAEKAWAQTTSEAATACGSGKPFWNVEAKEFMYVPSFQFQPVPGCKKYIYEATDETGKEHFFSSDSSRAPLAPIWKDIPEGIVSLRVYSTDKNDEKLYLIGARTFFRMAPFTDNYPPAHGSYRECALRAFDYCFCSPIIRHWLEKGTPYPDYDLNVYPSKMEASVIISMLRYGGLCPERNAGQNGFKYCPFQN